MTITTSFPTRIAGIRRFRFFGAGSTPTTDAIERTVKFPNFHLHLSAPWNNATNAMARS